MDFEGVHISPQKHKVYVPEQGKSKSTQSWRHYSLSQKMWKHLRATDFLVDRGGKRLYNNLCPEWMEVKGHFSP